MGILTKEQISECLQKYYVEHYGERDTDIWMKYFFADISTADG